jgi:hypothetical protein
VGFFSEHFVGSWDSTSEVIYLVSTACGADCWLCSSASEEWDRDREADDCVFGWEE